MHIATSSPAVKAAAERFRGFFEELASGFVEREDLLAQIALALLAREHVLMTGPPGTAKSGIAAGVLGRIVDERTGKPSVFARQFTESTVQTDLVGPIDFKTLMATGRTEHFTDEGMLGAVHAFLDEVLDGRDMLLRTTLNVLHERELKQGTKTTAGQIECALMTTNRYLAEVLEGSRETLLAFIDRIAFVSFVPKGFTDPASLGRVVRAQLAHVGAKPLSSLLTIQDLDLLQSAVERVVVPDEITTALCSLLEHLETDLAAAARSDPTFLPTRYLSTRTAVRLGRILRAVCVYDAVMNDGSRTLEVEERDLAMLRLSLLLSGPDCGKLSRLLERETDPRERRQLSILRTEREIFDRAIARLPKVPRRAPRAAPDIAPLAAAVAEAAPSADPTPLLQAAAKIAVVSDAGGPGSLAAAELLSTTLAQLSDRALRAGATAGAGPELEPEAVVAELARLADGLEKASGTTRPVARWLRGRAITLLLEAASFAGAGAGTRAALGPSDADEASAEQALAALERLFERIAALRAAGADDPDSDHAARAVATALARVEDDLVEAWDARFRRAVADALARVGTERLGVLLAALSPALADIDAVGARLSRLGGGEGSLKGRVVSPRIEPLVGAAFERVTAVDRLELVEQVAALVDHLQESGLRAVIPKETVLRFAATALVRSETTTRRSTTKESPDFGGYRALRAAEQRVSLAYIAVELAFRIAPDRRAPATPADHAAATARFIGSLPDDLRRQILELDLARVTRAVELVERWWKALAADTAAALEGLDQARVRSAMSKLASSKFFEVTRDEKALLRFALEARVLAEVFPEAAEHVASIRARIEAIEASSADVLNRLRRGYANAAWSELFVAPGKTSS